LARHDVLADIAGANSAGSDSLIVIEVRRADVAAKVAAREPTAKTSAGDPATEAVTTEAASAEAMSAEAATPEPAGRRIGCHHDGGTQGRNSQQAQN
jgi:hypothetical protein